MRSSLNILRPSPTNHTDAEIARRVCHLLEWDFFLPDGWVQATVSDGVVTLDGRVEYPREWAAIRRAIENIRSVQAVHLPEGLAVEPSTRRPANRGSTELHAAQCLQLKRATDATVDRLDAFVERVAI